MPAERRGWVAIWSWVRAASTFEAMTGPSRPVASMTWLTSTRLTPSSDSPEQKRMTES